MKLYEIPRDSKIRLHIASESTSEKELICTFKHLDGMYSLIYTPDWKPVHLSASTELKLVDGIYEIVE